MGSKPSSRRSSHAPTVTKPLQEQSKNPKAEKSRDTFSPHEVPEDDKQKMDRQDSVSNRDLMISYSHQDKEVMANLRGEK